jgi:hypothetical protein
MLIVSTVLADDLNLQIIAPPIKLPFRQTAP